MDNKELQKTVNPIYLTAKATLSLLNKVKDPDAVALMQYIGLETYLQERAKTIPPSFSNCYKIAQHARYEINNTASLRSSAPNIVDLPSGYSPRGFRVSSAGKRYFGFDLPVVIDDMAPAAHKVMSPQQRSLSSYHAVDATNYQSMKEALGSGQGRVVHCDGRAAGVFQRAGAGESLSSHSPSPLGVRRHLDDGRSVHLKNLCAHPRHFA